MHELLEYAKKFIGVHYKWGGANPMTGLDCSGFIQLVLDSVGIDPKEDQTAKALHSYFVLPKHGTCMQSHVAGALIFYGKSLATISHIDLAISKTQIIGAIGGGSTTVKLADAATANAFVKIKPANYRTDIQAIILPKYYFLNCQ